NEGRVRNLESLRHQRDQRRMRGGDVDLRVACGVKSGKMLMEAVDVSHAFENKLIVKEFCCKIMAGERIGLVGPNGIGKTALLNILLGELKPNDGRMRHGVRLATAFLKQVRHLNSEHKIKDVLLPQGGNYVYVGGSEPRHIVGYLEDFLFDKERLRAPVSALSGGERGRLMLAKLLLEPANLLVLDEPTNDLDIATLSVLEKALAKYSGTVLMVSHDRAFMDRVVSRVLAFEKNGQIVSIDGGYTDYSVWKSKQVSEVKVAPVKSVERKPSERKATKLSYKEQQQLDQLPQCIEVMESEKYEIETRFCDAEYFTRDGEAYMKDQKRLMVLESELADAYKAWEDLEEKQAELAG
ncbi:MAG: ATP-binding cassette domain-containing protein, partial [Mariprofundaceae bacterium]